MSSSAPIALNDDRSLKAIILGEIHRNADDAVKTRDTTPTAASGARTTPVPRGGGQPSPPEDDRDPLTVALARKLGL